MPIRPDDFATGGALLGAAAASLLRERERVRLPQPGERIGPFAIVEELGRGGMAVVYRAERADGEYAQTVALKWISGGGSDEGARALFRRERQALADLSHPHIARLLDGGHSADGQPWLAMEFIEGQRIDAYARARNLDLQARLRVFLQVCEAVAYAHARGLLHRDIKPSNVLVTADGQAKLLDFGIVQLIGEDDALARHAHTPGYASPEQMRGERLTVAADIYQLGRLLQRLLAGSEAEAEALTRGATVLHATAIEQRFDSSTLPSELRALIDCACAAEPAQRYATVEALMGDVRAFLELRPLEAMAGGSGYRLRCFVARHRMALIALVLVVLVLGALGLHAAQRIASERERAEREREAGAALNALLNEDLLAAANPLRRPPGAPEVTVREALAQAEQAAPERLAARPDLAMRVLTTLGQLRHEYGEYEAALALLERAIALGEGHGGDTEGLEAARGEAAAVRISMQDFDAATALLQPLVDALSARHGATSSEALIWRLRLLEARNGQGQHLETLPALDALRIEADTALGPRNAISAEADYLIASTLRFNNRPSEAAVPARRGLAAAESSLGADHPTALKLRTNLAHALNAEGRGAEAIEVLQRALALQQARYGPASADGFFMQNELGYLQFVSGDFVGAEASFAALAEGRAAFFGAHSPDVYAALSNLAGARLRQGRFEPALDALQRMQTIEAAETRLALPIRIGAGRLRVEALIGVGRVAEAGVALQQAEALAAELPESDLRRLAVMGARARWLLAQQDPAGAVLLVQVIEAMRMQVADTHPFLATLLELQGPG